MRTITAALLACAALAACSPTSPPASSTPSLGTPGAASASAPPAAAATTGNPAATAPARNAPNAFPPAAPLVHRGSAWLVVVALARTQSDPKLAAALRSVADIGYRDVVVNPVNECDEGLREGLKLKPGDYFHVSVPFADAATAQRFVDAYQPGVVGTVKVITGCAD